MKTTIKQYLCMAYSWGSDYDEEKWRPEIWRFKPGDDENLVFIREQYIEVDVPDDFNPVPAQIAGIEKKKLAALEEYQQTVAELNDRLSKLLALTNEVTT